MLEHGDLFRGKLTDDLYMIISEVNGGYQCIKLVESKSFIRDEEFFREQCTYTGNLAKKGEQNERGKT